MHQKNASPDAPSKMTGFGKWLGDSEQGTKKATASVMPARLPGPHNRTISVSRKRKRVSSNPPAKSSDESQDVSDTESEIQDTIICASTDPVSKVDDQPEDIPPHRSSLAKRSIVFSQVFQNGKAPVKHFIIQYPLNYGPWFILRCDEHDVNFSNQQGAAAHLRSNKHGHPRHVSTSMVIEHFSIEVIGCNAELAERNNSMALELSLSGAAKNPLSKTRPSTCPVVSARKKRSKLCASRAESDQQTTKRRRLKKRVRDGISNPTPGQIYLAYDEVATNWLPALILPQTGLGDTNTPTSLECLGLMGHIPECYTYDPQTKELKWKNGYEDGEPLAMERKFPAIFFDGSKFPEESAVGWVGAGDLQAFNVFDSASSLIPNLESARSYIRKRLGPKESSVKPADSPEPETLAPSGVKRSGSCAVSFPHNVPTSAQPAADSASSRRDTSSSETTQRISLESQLSLDNSVHKGSDSPLEVDEEGLLAVEKLPLSPTISERLPSCSLPSEIADRRSHEPCEPVSPPGNISPVQSAPESDAMQIDIEDSISQKRETSLPATMNPDLPVCQDNSTQGVNDGATESDERSTLTAEIPISIETLPQVTDLKANPFSTETVVLLKTAQPGSLDLDLNRRTPIQSVDGRLSKDDEGRTLTPENAVDSETLPQTADSEGDPRSRDTAAAASKMVHSNSPSPGPCLDNPVEKCRQTLSEPGQDSTLAAKTSTSRVPLSRLTDSQADPQPLEGAAVLSKTMQPTSPPPDAPLENCIQKSRHGSSEPAEESTLTTEPSISLEAVSQSTDFETEPLSPKAEGPLLETAQAGSPGPDVYDEAPIECVKPPTAEWSTDNPIDLDSRLESGSELTSHSGSPAIAQHQLNPGAQLANAYPHDTTYRRDGHYSPMRMAEDGPRTIEFSVPLNLIHKAHVKRALFDYTTAHLQNLQSTSTSLSFPKAIWRGEMPAIYLPPARLPAAQTPSSPIPGVSTMNPLSGSVSWSEIPAVQILREPPSASPVQTLASLSIPQTNPQAVLVHRRLGPRPPPKHQMAPAALRFGIAPFEVPPALLAILKRKSKSKEENPKLAEFCGIDGLYHCPMCKNRFAHGDVFTGHLCDKHWRGALNKTRQT